MGVEYVQVYKTIHNNFTLGSRASPRTGFRIESPQYPCSMFFFFLQRERERQRVKRKPRVVHLCVDQSYPTHSNSNYIHPSLRQTLRFVFLTKIRDIGWLIEFVEWHHFLPSALGISFNIVLQSETNKGVKVFFFFHDIRDLEHNMGDSSKHEKWIVLPPKALISEFRETNTKGTHFFNWCSRSALRFFPLAISICGTVQH